MIWNSLYRRASFYVNVYTVQVQAKGDRVPNNQLVRFIQQCGSVYYCCAKQTSERPDPASIPVVTEFLAQSGEVSRYVWVRVHASVYPHAFSRGIIFLMYWGVGSILWIYRANIISILVVPLESLLHKELKNNCIDVPKSVHCKILW